MGDDEEIVLFAFELEDDGFEADGEVVIGLLSSVQSSSIQDEENSPLHAGTCDGTGLARALRLRPGTAA